MNTVQIWILIENMMYICLGVQNKRRKTDGTIIISQDFKEEE